MSSSISLDISSGQGLSYAIDEALDKELGQNITLSKLRQWNTIFNYIKEEQAEQTQPNQKQFTEADNDIKNKSHYQVNEGKYNLTQNTWNRIVEYVKQELKLNTLVENDSEKAETQQNTKIVQSQEGVLSPEEADKKLRSEVKEYLSEFLQETKMEFKGEFALDVINKYKVMTEYAKNNKQTLTENDIKTRLYNYAKGWQFHNFELKTICGQNTVEFKSGAETAKTKDELKEKYGQFAEQYIEFYDQDASGDLNSFEIFVAEIKDHYQHFQNLENKQNLGYFDARKKALELLNDYKTGKLRPNEHRTTDEKFLANILAKIEFLDIGDGSDGDIMPDNILKKDEIMAYLLNMASQDSSANGKKNIITQQEVWDQFIKLSNSDLTEKKSLMDAYGYLHK